MNKTDKTDKNYSVIDILYVEDGLMIVRPENPEKHLVYIDEDRQLHYKDGNDLTNAEVSYLRDLALRHNSHVFKVEVIKKDHMVGHHMYHKSFTEAGFSGVLSSGHIVDRRIFPNAIPMQKNTLLGIPSPKINLE